MRFQKGQIALIVLLLMTVMLTIGLSVAQRGLFDTKVTEQEEETARAFQAAETGVEEALRTLVGTTGDKSLDTGVSYNVTVAEKGTVGFVTSETVGIEDVLELKVTGATASSATIYYYHTSTSSCSDAGEWGVEVEKVYEPSVGDPWLSRTVSMTDPLSAVEFQGQWFCKTVTSVTTIASDAFFTDLKKIRVRPIGKPTGAIASGTLLGFQPVSGDLPAQYRLISSQGKTSQGITRAVSVTRSLPQLPTVFDYALLSGGDLIKTKPQFTPYVPDPADFEATESIPVENATWVAGPVYVVVDFNMDLDPSSSLVITDNSTGASVNSGVTSVENNNRRLRQKTTIGVPTGQKTYKVTWQPCVAAGNCRTSNNTFTFTVNPDFTGYDDLRASNTVTVKLQNVVNGTGLDLPKVRMTRGKTLKFKNTISGQKRVITDTHLTGHTYMIKSNGDVWRTSKLGNGDSDTVPVDTRGAYYYHVDDGSDNYLSGYNGIVVVE